MPTSRSTLLGVLSLAPLVGFALLLVSLSYFAPGSAVSGGNSYLFFGMGAIYVTLSWLIVIGAIVLTLKSYRMRRSQKVMWVIVLLFFNMFALPVLWHKHFRGPVHGAAT